MTVKKILESRAFVYLVLFIITLAVVFHSTYNPFNFRRMQVDSSVYVAISDRIARGGVLPYKDLADNKGPLTYLISVPGLFLCGVTGIWITQFIIILVSVLFAFKTALFFAGKYKALLGVLFSFILAINFFYVGAGTGEYSLPFLMISIYIFTKYYFTKKEACFPELIVLGICFSSAIMIRLNMFPLWAGFCLVIFVESIKKQKYTQLLKYICGFLLGILFVFLPILIYLKANGIFNYFLDQAIFGGTARGFSGVTLKYMVQNFYDVLRKKFFTS